jgi:hypothetical protein
MIEMQVVVAGIRIVAGWEKHQAALDGGGLVTSGYQCGAMASARTSANIRVHPWMEKEPNSCADNKIEQPYLRNKRSN